MTDSKKHIFLASATGSMIVFIVFLVIVSCAQAEEVLELTLKPRVEADNGVIYVRDIVSRETIADIRSANSQDILDVELCKAPNPGKSRQLQRSFIVMRLKNNDIDVSNLRFGGVKTVNIHRLYSVLGIDELRKVVRKHCVRKYKKYPMIVPTLFVQ